MMWLVSIQAFTLLSAKLMPGKINFSMINLETHMQSCGNKIWRVLEYGTEAYKLCHKKTCLLELTQTGILSYGKWQES